MAQFEPNDDPSSASVRHQEAREMRRVAREMLASAAALPEWSIIGRDLENYGSQIALAAGRRERRAGEAE